MPENMTTYYHDSRREVAIAFAIANSKPGEDIIVQNQDGSIDYVLYPEEIKFIQDAMRKALEVTNA